VTYTELSSSRIIRAIMRLLIVGEAPSRLVGEPLTGPTGRRLAGLMDIDHGEMLERFDRLNLLEEWPGRDGRGSAFPLLLAMSRALELRDGPWDAYLLLGKRVAAAFGFRSDVRYLAWYGMDGKRFAVLPHPSGVNRWFNEPANRALARRFLRSVVRQSQPSAAPR
jgi:hypothetical protein